MFRAVVLVTGPDVGAVVVLADLVTGLGGAVSACSVGVLGCAVEVGTKKRLSV
jgi:hypothetical protein